MHKNFYLNKLIPITFLVLFAFQASQAAACEWCPEEECLLSEPGVPSRQCSTSRQPHRRAPAQHQYGRFNYIKLGGSLVSRDQTEDIAPAIGLGKRYSWDSSAVDLSANFGGDDNEFHYSIPKIMYLRYLTPESAGSFYLGGGLSWGGIHSYDEKFEGILGEFAAGYEFQRASPICAFIELDVTQGLISASRQGVSRPALMLTMGVGY